MMDAARAIEFFAEARRSITGFTWYGTYPEACALVMGYDEGLGRGTLVDGFQRWTAERRGSEPNVIFWWHVLKEALPDRLGDGAADLSPEEHRIAVAMLFDRLIEYLNESVESKDRPSR